MQCKTEVSIFERIWKGMHTELDPTFIIYVDQEQHSWNQLNYIRLSSLQMSDILVWFCFGRELKGLEQTYMVNYNSMKCS